MSGRLGGVVGNVGGPYPLCTYQTRPLAKLRLSCYYSIPSQYYLLLLNRPRTQYPSPSALECCLKARRIV